MNSMSLSRRSVGFAWVALAGLVLGAGQGCSGGKKSDPYGRVVTGKVTYQGNPVEGAFVTFASAGGNSAFGRTDAEGKYKLAASGSDKVPLGEYRVSIVKKEQQAAPGAQAVLDPEHPENYVPPDPNAPPPPEPKDLLPAKYAQAGASGLSATVTADGENVFEFALTD
jgi:hypothetical protein